MFPLFPSFPSSDLSAKHCKTSKRRRNSLNAPRCPWRWCWERLLTQSFDVPMQEKATRCQCPSLARLLDFGSSSNNGVVPKNKVKANWSLVGTLAEIDSSETIPSPNLICKKNKSDVGRLGPWHVRKAACISSPGLQCLNLFGIMEIQNAESGRSVSCLVSVPKSLKRIETIQALEHWQLKKGPEVPKAMKTLVPETFGIEKNQSGIVRTSICSSLFNANFEGRAGAGRRKHSSHSSWNQSQWLRRRMLQASHGNARVQSVVKCSHRFNMDTGPFWILSKSFSNLWFGFGCFGDRIYDCWGQLLPSATAPALSDA